MSSENEFTTVSSRKRTRAVDKYPFLKTLDKDFELYVTVPKGTKYNDIKSLFSEFGTFSIPQPKDDFSFLVKFNENPEAANKAMKKRQYYPMKDSFIMIRKKSTKVYIDQTAKIHIPTKRTLDPKKLHDHFDSTTTKVCFINKTINGYLVQYYTKEDCDEAYKMLKDETFEGIPLKIEKHGDSKPPSSMFTSNSVSKSVSKASSVIGNEKLQIEEDGFSSGDDDTWEVRGTQKIEQGTKIGLNSKKQDNPCSASFNQQREESKEPVQNLESKKVINSQKDIAEAEKKEKKIIKLSKDFKSIMNNEKIIEILVRKLRTLEDDKLIEYLVSDDWVYEFFKDILVDK